MKSVLVSNLGLVRVSGTLWVMVPTQLTFRILLNTWHSIKSLVTREQTQSNTRVLQVQIALTVEQIIKIRVPMVQPTLTPEQYRDYKY